MHCIELLVRRAHLSSADDYPSNAQRNQERGTDGLLLLSPSPVNATSFTCHDSGICTKAPLLDAHGCCSIRNAIIPRDTWLMFGGCIQVDARREEKLAVRIQGAGHDDFV